MPTTLDVTLKRIFDILRVIGEKPGLSMTDLINELGLSRATLTHIVGVLVDLGLVEKRVGGMPRRVSLYLTPKGECIAKCLK